MLVAAFTWQRYTVRHDTPHLWLCEPVQEEMFGCENQALGQGGGKVGKELVDLKDAMDKGALTQDEYAKAKKDILAGGPVKFEADCSAKK